MTEFLALLALERAASNVFEYVREDAFVRALKYNPRHKPAGSSEGGQFAESEGGGVVLSRAKTKVFKGKPVEVDNQLSKLETGDLGEDIAKAYLKDVKGLDDVRIQGLTAAEKATDIYAGDKLYEVKAGQVSNGPSAQQWRMTIGQTGKEEQAMLDKMDPEHKAAYNAVKQEKIMARKNAMLKAVSRQTGVKMSGSTLTMIINNDTSTADIYEFEGFHQRIPWNGPLAKSAYVGTYRYRRLS